MYRRKMEGIRVGLDWSIGERGQGTSSSRGVEQDDRRIEAAKIGGVI